MYIYTYKLKKIHTQKDSQRLLTYLQTNKKMPGLCMSRAAARVRVCVRSPAQQYKKGASFIKGEEKSDLSNETNGLSSNNYLPASESGNRVMVVVDSSPEAIQALEWALSHTVQSQDTIVLLRVAKKDGKSMEINQRAYDLLQATKCMCQLRRPEVHVELAIREGIEKGATIVEAAKQLKASLLVLGHRKQSPLRRLQTIWTRKRSWSSVVDYCIQKANCLTIAVRRKNRRYGGYLITTKRHKKFWLLA
ncbi:hypothetical protein CDL12_27993 [Handroanthus impetiginosus]|uniref:UspA domain-containing protein n=1 Tax=Handroanthus impetiginosus TaxID=429701 RepID=A0A2G9G2H2_9LAMI|nr:hypothetical protein CDL12_27993 [Handroanthus impetiginosus]